MSLDARVTTVTYLPDGRVRLDLEPWDARVAPTGQHCLYVVNPLPGMEAAVGTHLWGPSNCVMVGKTRWAERVTATTIRLNPPPGVSAPSPGGLFGGVFNARQKGQGR